MVRIFECQKCCALIRLFDDTDKYLVPLKYPLECYEDQGGCGRKSVFRELRPDYDKNSKKEE